MIKDHKKAHLNVPDFVKAEWKSRDQNSMAQILMDSNWDKAGVRLKLMHEKKINIFEFAPFLFNIYIYIYKHWLLDQDAFVARVEVIIHKKKTLKLRVEEQWLCEKDMKTDLKWSPFLVSIIQVQTRNLGFFLQAR